MTNTQVSNEKLKAVITNCKEDILNLIKEDPDNGEPAMEVLMVLGKIEALMGAGKLIELMAFLVTQYPEIN